MTLDCKLGIDIGGQTSKLGVVDARGAVLAQTVIRSDIYGADAQAYVDALAEVTLKLIKEAGKEGQIRGIGVGAPRYINSICKDAFKGSGRNSCITYQ